MVRSVIYTQMIEDYLKKNLLPMQLLDILSFSNPLGQLDKQTSRPSLWAELYLHFLQLFELFALKQPLKQISAIYLNEFETFGMKIITNTILMA